jgi:hypothetical protein
VSIEGSSDLHEPSFNNIDFSSFAMGSTFSLPHDLSASDLLQSYASSGLEPIAFTDGGLDASFGPSLDLSFDEFIHHDGSATVAVDGHGAL